MKYFTAGRSISLLYTTLKRLRVRKKYGKSVLTQLTLEEM